MPRALRFVRIVVLAAACALAPRTHVFGLTAAGAADSLPSASVRASR